MNSETTSEPAKPSAVALGSGRGETFWRIGVDVYRAPEGASTDSWGLPLGRRWECSLAHWQHYRKSVFEWVEESKSS